MCADDFAVERASGLNPRHAEFVAECAAEVSVERVLREVAVLALAPAELALPVPRVLSAKLKALEVLGKHLGLFLQPGEAGAGGTFTQRLDHAIARLQAH
ncbi:MAG TPA: hypothetical protein DCM87_08065 [Planctomycetes bacterium]|nr:hypothetical protein [Planctomycetota bacterium]